MKQPKIRLKVFKTEFQWFRNIAALQNNEMWHRWMAAKEGSKKGPKKGRRRTKEVEKEGQASPVLNQHLFSAFGKVFYA